MLVTINGESLEGLNVAQVCDKLKVSLNTQVWPLHTETDQYTMTRLTQANCRPCIFLIVRVLIHLVKNAGTQAASRPVALMLRPGSMELKLIAYEDHTHDGAKVKKDKKKSKKK